jgi:pimeloyl-ACP methyl ester carboxylesterase
LLPPSALAQADIQFQALVYVPADADVLDIPINVVIKRFPTAAFVRWFGRFERLGARPASAAALMRMNSQIDISDIVSTIRVPTLVVHRTDDKAINVEGGRFLAEHIPGARYIELPGVDHAPMIGDNADEIADAIQEFLTGARAPVEVDRVLSTVLFTDVVGSTQKAAVLGDRRWRDLLDKHHALI